MVLNAFSKKGELPLNGSSPFLILKIGLHYNSGFSIVINILE